MILLRANFEKLHLVACLKLDTDVFQNHVDILVKYRTPIVRWEHKMLEQNRDVVALIDILAHISFLYDAPSGGELDPKRLKLHDRRELQHWGRIIKEHYNGTYDGCQGREAINRYRRQLGIHAQEL